MRTLSKISILFVFVSLIWSCNTEKKSEQVKVPTSTNFDVVILNGRVMDPETNFDEIRNVGILYGKISLITEEKISDKETIDAKGHVVAPGFIDNHWHWPRPVGYKLGLRDGVTTAMDLEWGCYGPNVGKWYDMHKGRSQMNYGTGSSHEAARAAVLQEMENVDELLDAPMSAVAVRSGDGWAYGVLDLEKGNEMLKILDAGLQQGALGISATMGYWPGNFARETFEVHRLAGRYDRFYAIHSRYTPGNATLESNGAQEILANAVALNAPAVVCHFNNPGWQLVHELLVDLRAQGYNVWGEIYPYAAGSTTINAAFIKPENWVEKLGNTYETTLKDPDTGEFYTLETYLKEVAENPTKEILLYKAPEEDIPSWVALPGVVTASDAMSPVLGGWDQLPWDVNYDDIPNTHPRVSGTRGKSLRIAREYNIPLMQVISTMSYNSALYLGNTGLESMKIRGRMQEGMVADITIFDPNSVTDNATYEKGLVPTTGIPYVLVNGTIVVKDSRVLPDVFSGQPIRFETVESKYQPVDPEKWVTQFLGNPIKKVHGIDDCIQH